MLLEHASHFCLRLNMVFDKTRIKQPRQVVFLKVGLLKLTSLKNVSTLRVNGVLLILESQTMLNIV